MEPTQLQELLTSFQTMAKANQDMVALVQAERATGNVPTTDPTTTPTTRHTDNPGAVAIAGI